MALPFSLSIKPFHAYTRFQMYRRYERGRCLCQLRLLCPNRKHIERESRLTVYHVKVNPRTLIRTSPLFILHGGRRLIITRYQEPYHKTSEWASILSISLCPFQSLFHACPSCRLPSNISPFFLKVAREERKRGVRSFMKFSHYLLHSLLTISIILC